MRVRLLNEEQVLGTTVSVKTDAGTRGIFTCSTVSYMQNVTNFYFYKSLFYKNIIIFIFKKTFNLRRHLVIRTRTFAMCQNLPYGTLQRNKDRFSSHFLVKRLTLVNYFRYCKNVFGFRRSFGVAWMDNGQARHNPIM